MKLIYNVSDRPKFGANIIFSLQQLLAIMAATIVVPVIINTSTDGMSKMSPAAALFGAGVGTIVYVLFTLGRSPVFLGSSFAFIGSMCAAFAGASSMALGYLGLIIGAVFAGLVYVVIAIIVHFSGAGWVNKLMPAVVIGPTVSIIGLSLAGNAISDLTTAPAGGNYLVALLCGLVTLSVTVLCSTYGKKAARLIPFIIGIAAGYIFSLILTLIGRATGCDALLVTNFAAFEALAPQGAVSLSTFLAVPDYTFLTALGAFGEITPSYIATIAVAYVPVAFVVFAEHIADHKNISSIIEKDLLEDPGLSRTLLGDGIGSMAGAFFGGCPNTTYGESVGCVAITGNASIYSIVGAAALAIIAAFISPFVALINTIPSCVMGGVCVALYGFIAVSGLKMIQNVDLGENHNLFVVSTILITGIGGLTLTFGKVTITSIATALILGILVNTMLGGTSKKDNAKK